MQYWEDVCNIEQSLQPFPGHVTCTSDSNIVIPTYQSDALSLFSLSFPVRLFKGVTCKEQKT